MADSLLTNENPQKRLSELYGRLRADANGPVRSFFQPIIDLHSQGVVGYEALTRGPAGSDLESPDQLFGAAREAGMLAEFDRACRDAALERARAAGVAPPLTVFLNVEPEVVEWPEDARSDTTWVEAPREMRCCIELTERSLTQRPAELLYATAGIRELGWGLAMDDVGVDPRSLALLPVLRPDIVKLDLRLIQNRTTRATSEVVSAVAAHVHDTGAVVVAEGIETEEHAAIALALGATHGQGYLYGRPEPLSGEVTGGGSVRFLGAALEMPSSPFALVAARQETRRCDAQMMATMRERLLEHGAMQDESAVILAAHPDGSALSLERMSRAALVGLVSSASHDMAIHTATLADDDAMRDEEAVVVVGPHFAGAVVARGLGSVQTTYDFAVTHDRDLVVDCARSILGRLRPASPHPHARPAA